MKKFNFQIGQKLTGYLDNDMPFDGYIISFAGEDKKLGPKAVVKFYNSEGTGIALLNTCHPMEVDKISHSKKSFLAAASRVGPVLYFKDAKARRDFLEVFWEELCLYTDKKPSKKE